MSLGKPIPAKPHLTAYKFAGFSVHGMYELTKPRLSLLSVFTASLGYLVREPFRQIGLFLFVSPGDSSCCSWSGAQSMDGKMKTPKWPELRLRPLPAGLVSSQFAVIFGIILSSIGLYILWAGTNPGPPLDSRNSCGLSSPLHPYEKRSPYATEVGQSLGSSPDWVGVGGRRCTEHLRLDSFWYSFT